MLEGLIATRFDRAALLACIDCPGQVPPPGASGCRDLLRFAA